MKTRTATIVGSLYLQNMGDEIKEYLLIRAEVSDLLAETHSFTVAKPFTYYPIDAKSEDEGYHAAPFLVTTNAPWLIEHCKPFDIQVEDDTSEDDFEPTPSPDDPDWESIFKEEDKQNTIETPDPE